MYAGVDWLELICQPDGGERSVGARELICTFKHTHTHTHTHTQRQRMIRRTFSPNPRVRGQAASPPPHLSPWYDLPSHIGHLRTMIVRL